MLRKVLLGAGLTFLAVLLMFAIFGPSIRHTPFAQAGTPNLGPGGDYWLGTDELGRDVFARIAYGARISLFVGFTVQIIALAVGIIMGVLGTFSPKWLSLIILRFTDGMFAFPDILLGILLIGMFQSALKTGGGIVVDTLPVVIVLSITAWPSFTRLTVTQLATLKDREFVVAAKASGASTFYIVTRHILPQLWGILLAVSMVELAGTILAESTLSFIGIGVKPPTPSWGNMIDTARQNMNSNPTLLIWPCLCLSITIFALNFVGDGLRAYFDPKGR